VVSNVFLSLCALWFLVLGTMGSGSAVAQSANKVWKVGILWHAGTPQEEEVMFRPLVEGLRELGYIEGRNLVFEHTYVNEDYSGFPARAQELIDRKVDIILASVAPAALAANRLTKTIPIVFATSGDPVKIGLVKSIRQPGGNVTGLSLFVSELTAKHLEILRNFVPDLARVAILWYPRNQDHPLALQETERAAEQLKLQTIKVAVNGAEDFDNAFSVITKADVNGLIVLGDAMLRVNHKPIVQFATKARLPAVYAARDYVDAGGLVSYGVCIPCNFRRSAAFIDKILKGTKPTDLPVELPAQFTMVVNGKTAKMLGLTVPQSVILAADEVLE
jgi:putative tryptophan/tyrosine transport system substrate-binding protein